MGSNLKFLLAKPKPMPVHVVADLHLHRWPNKRRGPFQSVARTDSESLAALIVAGDLSNKHKVRWQHMVRHLARYIASNRTFLLPSSHDYLRNKKVDIKNAKKLASSLEVELLKIS